MKFAFIREHQRRWPIEVMCRVLRVSRSGFYAWRRRPPSRRSERAALLLAKIRAAHHASRELYGYPRVHRALLIDGESVSRNTIARLMRRANIRGRRRRGYVPRTTDSAHDKPIADNLLERDFAADRPNQKWLADITYIPTNQGWLYLAAVLDCYSRKVVGWSMADHMESDLVSAALEMALLHRRPRRGAGLMHHSDRGIQYTSAHYRRLLDARGITVSMSRRGDCLDNAMMESFWATLKCELIEPHRYATHEQARAAVFEYIEVFYNRQRLHSSLGYVSPETFEAAA
jgi:transposase InsO family protein